jgi:lysophospholipase L1-like esterase
LSCHPAADQASASPWRLRRKRRSSGADPGRDSGGRGAVLEVCWQARCAVQGSVDRDAETKRTRLERRCVRCLQFQPIRLLSYPGQYKTIAEKRVQKTLVCFGDSNTHGTVPMVGIDDNRRFGSDQRWTGLLARELGPDWQIHEEGLPGRTTVHADPIEGEHLSGLAAVPMVIGTHTPIDAMTLMLGTNDLKARFGIEAADIAAGIERLILTIHMCCLSSGRQLPRILLIAPPPILETGCLREMFGGGKAKSEKFADYLAHVAQRYKLDFLNAGDHIRSSDVDGIHFDVDQQAHLANAVRRQLDARPLDHER